MREALLAATLALSLTGCASELRLGTGEGQYPAGVRVYEYARKKAGDDCSFRYRSGTEADRAGFDFNPCGDRFKGEVEGARAFEGQRQALEAQLAAAEARRAAAAKLAKGLGSLVKDACVLASRVPGALAPPALAAACAPGGEAKAGEDTPEVVIIEE